MLWFRRLNALAVVWCFCLVAVGAYVRLSDAGLGCPDWPGCYGHLTVPEAPHDVSAAQQLYPDRPVEAPKAWKEMIHRYLAETLGLFIVVLALSSRFIKDQRRPRVLPWLLVALVIFQGMLGMWTVTWQLKPLVVTGHLFGGMSTFALLLWMWLGTRARADVASTAELPAREMRNERAAAFALQRDLSSDARPAAMAALTSKGLRAFALAGLLVLICQIFLGGWTSTNYAALACPDLPTCQGSFLPPLDVKEAFTLWRGLGINYEYGILDARARVTIHYFHRVGALITTLVLLSLVIYLLRRPAILWRRLGLAVLAALALQVSLGISIVHFQLPLLLAAAHNLGAETLLGTLVVLNYFAWRGTRRQDD
ncbi:COX15/CtaA family protein [Solimonas terrae]|uniref:Heme A synthase n=1 Tax=Solimonas terrae TaxID=1396819 RepID=A0A6M2BST6_9GAMM|nr:COX15/CtaA family protein [Solimonas terrae]NGY05079.1 heme A synthase [Solimonas terrae]